MPLKAELAQCNVMYQRLKPENICQADSTWNRDRAAQKGSSSLAHGMFTHPFLSNGILTCNYVFAVSDFRQQGV